MQEYVDGKTKGDLKTVRYYDKDAGSDHLYMVSVPWNSSTGAFWAEVRIMCDMLSKRGLEAADLLLGSQAAAAVTEIPTVQKLLGNRRMDAVAAPAVEPLSGNPIYNADTNGNDLRKMLKAAGITAKVGMKKEEMLAALDEFYGNNTDSGVIGDGVIEDDDVNDDIIEDDDGGDEQPPLEMPAPEN